MKAISAGFTILVILLGASMRMYRIGQMINGDTSGRSHTAFDSDHQSEAAKSERARKRKAESVQKNPFLD